MQQREMLIPPPPPPLPYGMMDGEDDDDDLEPPPPISNSAIVHSPSHRKIGVFATSRTVPSHTSNIRDKEEYHSSSSSSRQHNYTTTYSTPQYTYDTTKYQYDKNIKTRRSSVEALEEALVMYSPSKHRSKNNNNNNNKNSNISPIHESLTRIKKALTETSSPILPKTYQSEDNLDDLLSSITRMKFHIKRMRGPGSS